MIVSASRRTDIPAYYAEWFLNRLRVGFVLVPSPRNPYLINQFSLSPNVVDCIIFWTKNPRPLLPFLGQISQMGYPFYFQFTLTPYGRDLEPGVPSKQEAVQTFQALGSRIGADRLIWRYDPIILNPCYPVSWHQQHFSALAAQLKDYTRRCIISFIDLYPHMDSNTAGKIGPLAGTAQKHRLASALSQIASTFGIQIFSCAESVDLLSYGIRPASCIDRAWVETAAGYRIHSKKDPGQRPLCRCVESIDIGCYNSCPAGCIYCYSTTSSQIKQRHRLMHDPSSPLLMGQLSKDQKIVAHTAKSLRDPQTSLFSF